MVMGGHGRRDHSKEPNNGQEAMDGDSDEEDSDYVPGFDPNEPGAAYDEDENYAAAGGANDATPVVLLSITKQKPAELG